MSVYDLNLIKKGENTHTHTHTHTHTQMVAPRVQLFFFLFFPLFMLHNNTLIIDNLLSLFYFSFQSGT